ncbi:hypothetical protein [Lacrimispora xylanisolvens]|uniref:hypothetical protein n=1 Tax=Lacrimispora TaxID=2719231 RepID=UPI001FA86108|nr:hypothetical protein [Hungatella xylanolytica]
MGPPPSSAPPKPAQARSGSATKMVSPGSMQNCIGRFTYIWMSNGQEFWFFPIQIWRDSVSGFRWDRRFGWSYTGISLNRIDMFTCSW